MDKPNSRQRESKANSRCLDVNIERQTLLTMDRTTFSVEYCKADIQVAGKYTGNVLAYCSL
jgi:hypothetical protein